MCGVQWGYTKQSDSLCRPYVSIIIMGVLKLPRARGGHESTRERRVGYPNRPRRPKAPFDHVLSGFGGAIKACHLSLVWLAEQTKISRHAPGSVSIRAPSVSSTQITHSSQQFVGSRAIFGYRACSLAGVGRAKLCRNSGTAWRRRAASGPAV